MSRLADKMIETGKRQAQGGERARKYAAVFTRMLDNDDERKVLLGVCNSIEFSPSYLYSDKFKDKQRSIAGETRYADSKPQKKVLVQGPKQLDEIMEKYRINENLAWDLLKCHFSPDVNDFVSDLSDEIPEGCQELIASKLFWGGLGTVDSFAEAEKLSSILQPNLKKFWEQILYWGITWEFDVVGLAKNSTDGSKEVSSKLKAMLLDAKMFEAAKLEFESIEKVVRSSPTCDYLRLYFQVMRSRKAGKFLSVNLTRDLKWFVKLCVTLGEGDIVRVDQSGLYRPNADGRKKMGDWIGSYWKGYKVFSALTRGFKWALGNGKSKIVLDQGGSISEDDNKLMNEEMNKYLLDIKSLEMYKIMKVKETKESATDNITNSNSKQKKGLGTDNAGIRK